MFALLILYAIVGLIRETLSAPALGQGGGTHQASSHATSRGVSGLEATTFSQHAKTRRRIMSTGISKSPDSRYWRQLYRAALSEIDKSKLPERIAEAEKAVVLRARELFQAAGDNGEETEAQRCDVRLARFTKQLPKSGSVLVCFLFGIKVRFVT